MGEVEQIRPAGSSMSGGAMTEPGWGITVASFRPTKAHLFETKREYGLLVVWTAVCGREAFGRHEDGLRPGVLKAGNWPKCKRCMELLRRRGD